MFSNFLTNKSKKSPDYYKYRNNKRYNYNTNTNRLYNKTRTLKRNLNEKLDELEKRDYIRSIKNWQRVIRDFEDKINDINKDIRNLRSRSLYDNKDCGDIVKKKDNEMEKMRDKINELKNIIDKYKDKLKDIDRDRDRDIDRYRYNEKASNYNKDCLELIKLRQQKFSKISTYYYKDSRKAEIKRNIRKSDIIDKNIKRILSKAHAVSRKTKNSDNRKLREKRFAKRERDNIFDINQIEKILNKLNINRRKLFGEYNSKFSKMYKYKEWPQFIKKKYIHNLRELIYKLYTGESITYSFLSEFMLLD